MNDKTFIRFLKWSAALIVAFNLVLGLTIAWVAYESIEQRDRLEQIAEENFQANCVQLRTAKDRVAATTTFLAEHPGAEPIPGVSRALLLRGLERDQEQVEALDFLSCPEE